ncbi:MAG: DUF547 domain-containing protein [Halioglobus sp.]
MNKPRSRTGLGFQYLLLLFMLLTPPTALAELDTASWTRLLGTAVTNGHVNYTLWENNREFNALVDQIATTQIKSMDRDHQLAFYINAYNILAAQGILDGSSPDSLLGRYLYFKRDKYTVAGQRITLYQLEHERIRTLKEPRIHFAIVCASQSCPILRNEAYTPPNLDQQLDTAARDFINNPERNRFDIDSNHATLSSIFKWFEEDFVASAGSLQAYLAPLVTSPEVADLLRKEAFDISYGEYDWNLNGMLQVEDK